MLDLEVGGDKFAEEMRMKKTIKLLAVGLLLGQLCAAPVVHAAETARVERSAQTLTSKEKKIVDALVDEFVTTYKAYKSEKKNRTTKSIITDTLADIIFNTAFGRDSELADLILNDYSSYGWVDWYNSLPNTETRELMVYDEVTQQNLTLKSKYIDNGADKTILLQHGWRSNGYNMMSHAQQYSALGYNLLIPDARAHGESEGDYNTFGHYEQHDLNKLLDDELRRRPEQELIVIGVSLGAATTMLSQETPHQNVIAYVADSGFQSMDKQFRSLIGMIYEYIQFIPEIDKYDWDESANWLLDFMEEHRIKPILGMSLADVSPLAAVQKSPLPKLFLHSEADAIIKMEQTVTLYNRAVGYKELHTRPGSAHAQLILDYPDEYADIVMTFISSVREQQTDRNCLPAKIAEKKNLLENPSFQLTETGFESWLVKENGAFIDKRLQKNSKGEWVLSKYKKTKLDGMTAAQAGNGVSFYAYPKAEAVMLGQEVWLQAGQTYRLDFSVQNTSPGRWTIPEMIYGFGDQMHQESLKLKKTVTKSLNYTPATDESATVQFGSQVNNYNIFDYNYTYLNFSDIAIYNADFTPPAQVKLTDTTYDVTENKLTGTGQGEPDSLINIFSEDGNVLKEVRTDAKGMFRFELPHISELTHVHIVNCDANGNQSISKVLYLK